MYNIYFYKGLNRPTIKDLKNTDFIDLWTFSAIKLKLQRIA